jgi:hypothetical protein
MTEKYLPAPTPPPKLTMAEVQIKFEHWRRTRKSRKPIPKKLWNDAVILSKEISINKVAKALRLNYTALRDRVHGANSKESIEKPSASSFIEIDFSNSVSTTSECIVEMEKKCGAKMRMCFRGKTDFDPLSLSKAFWNNGT